MIINSLSSKYFNFLKANKIISDNENLLYFIDGGVKIAKKKLIFTERQLNIMKLLFEERKTVKEIANELQITEQIVRNQFKSIEKKFTDYKYSIYFYPEILKKSKDFREFSIFNTTLKDSTKHQLIQNRVIYLEQLYKLTKDDLAKMTCVGPRKIEEILNFLESQKAPLN